MIGWENNQGAYFIQKLKSVIESVSEKATDAYSNTLYIGKMSDLLTTAKDTLVKAINEVYNKIGNLSSLTTTSKTSVVSAINEVNSTASGANSTANYAASKMSFIGSIAKDESIYINFNSSGASGIEDFLVIGGAQVINRICMWIVHLSSNNTIQYYPIITEGNQLSSTASGNTLTVTNTIASGSGSCYLNVICLSDYGYVEANYPDPTD